MRTGRPVKVLTLSAEERVTLHRWARRPKSAQRLAQRARIVLLCGEGLSNTGVARQVGVTIQTVGKWRGRDHAVPGGLGTAHARVGDATVAAIAVVNAVGDVVGDEGRVLAGSTAPAGTPGFPDPHPFEETANTTLVVVVTDGRCDKLGCHLVAQSAHDGIARSLRPSHTRFDGDLTVACATGSVDVHLDRLQAAAADAVAASIRAAVDPG
jgi:L-aminopeptidase/D-esterase-like protein